MPPEGNTPKGRNVIRKESADNVVCFNELLTRHQATSDAMSVLVADDQSASRLVLTGILRKAGHQVHAASTGEEALEFLSNYRCDVALLDVHMPGTGGIDILRLARVMEAGSCRRTRFVMLSADTSPSVRTICLSNGASAFLAKPITIAGVLDAIASPVEQEIGDRALERRDVDVMRDLFGQFAAFRIGRQAIRAFFDECVRDASASIEDLDRIVAAQQWHALHDLCHSLRGAASNMGAISLADAASEIANLGRMQLREDGARRIECLRSDLVRARATLLSVISA
jgi:CheY-like chemotaxis protein/HPt (histidine-containing phosphotransfer) domain-containing protein